MREDQQRWVEAVEVECDRFLGLYCAESKVEVCEKAMAPIFEALRSFLNTGHARECGCENIINLARKPVSEYPGCELVVLMNRKLEIAVAVGSFPEHQQLFVAVKPPRITDLKELSLIGITPYDVVQNLKKFSMSFTVMSIATQPPASA